jgi:hypothetical protein
LIQLIKTGFSKEALTFASTAYKPFYLIISIYIGKQIKVKEAMKASMKGFKLAIVTKIIDFCIY